MTEGIDYTVRISHRARYARIVVSPNMSVEVVLPTGVPKLRAAALLQEKKSWVQRSLKRFKENIRPENLEAFSDFPKQVVLEALGLTLPVFYHQTDSDSIRVVETASGLYLSGHVHDAKMVRAGLQRWLKRKAKKSFPENLEELAKLHGFSYQKISIRLQKSRWGSCTKNGNISLNAKLLFLPRELMFYVMLHELSHLKHMNHSKAFWAVVAQCDADYLLHRKEMRKASFWMPSWAES